MWALDSIPRAGFAGHRDRLRTSIDAWFARDKAAPSLFSDPGVVKSMRRRQEGEVRRRNGGFGVDRRREEVVSPALGRGFGVQHQTLDDSPGGERVDQLGNIRF